MPYTKIVLTVIETPTFARLAADYWTEEEGEEFIAWIAKNPRRAT